MTKLLVASGMGNLNSVEVVNLDESNPGLTCDNLQDLPYKLAGSTAQLFQGERPIICGGAEDSGINACDCFELQEGSWISIASLSTCRRLAPSANVSLQNGDDWFIIAGGSKYAFGDLASVEAFDGNIWSQEKVPSLPSNVGDIAWLGSMKQLYSQLGELNSPMTTLDTPLSPIFITVKVTIGLKVQD